MGHCNDAGPTAYNGGTIPAYSNVCGVLQSSSWLHGSLFGNGGGQAMVIVQLTMVGPAQCVCVCWGGGGGGGDF